MNKLLLPMIMLGLLLIQQPVQAGWWPCTYTCPDNWDDRPKRDDGYPICCYEGERICSASGNYILRCGDYDYYGDPIWDIDACLEFPSTTEDMGYCEYGCVRTTSSGNVGGTCYESDPCAGGDGCNYVGETRCGRVNFGGESVDAVFTCQKEPGFGCLVWSTEANVVCEPPLYQGCAAGKCIAREDWEQSECTPGVMVSPTQTKGAADRKCFGDYLCYCTDRDGDGIAVYDRPTDYPTTCVPCEYGCNPNQSPPGCRTEDGGTWIGCIAGDKRCYGNYLQSCTIDMGDHFDWTPPNWESEYCEFGCQNDACLSNPDDEDYISQNQCTKGGSRCIESNYQQDCDSDCGDTDDNTWCWGTIKLCTNLLCDKGKCRDSLGPAIQYEIIDLPDGMMAMSSLTTDGEFLYSLTGGNYSAATWDQFTNKTIVKMNTSGDVVDSVDLGIMLECPDTHDNLNCTNPTQYAVNFPRLCPGAVGYNGKNNTFYLLTPAIMDVEASPMSIISRAYEFTWNNSYISNNVTVLNSTTMDTLGACSVHLRDDRIIGSYTAYVDTALGGTTGGLVSFYLNGTADHEYFNITGVADLCYVTDTFTKAYCWDYNIGLKMTDDRIYTIALRNITASSDQPNKDDFNWFDSNSVVSAQYAYIDAYGCDNYYYGHIANITEMLEKYIPLGLEKIGDTFFILAKTPTGDPWSGTTDYVLLKVNTAFVNANECSEGSQKCTGWPIVNQYVECVRDPITGVWKWYQPGLFGDQDDTKITTCGGGEVCDSYWVNHRITKAQCIDPSCVDVCDIGEKRCNEDAPARTWVEECVYLNVSRYTWTGAVDILNPIACKGWNKTEHCGGYIAATYGYCSNGQCIKKESANECKYINATNMDSKCIYTYNEDDDGSMLIRAFVTNCTDIDGDGDYEFDLNNASGMLQFCQFGCNSTFLNDSYGNIQYAQCIQEYSNSTMIYRNLVAEYSQWFKILFPDLASRIIFSLIFMSVISGLLFIKGSWELGLTSVLLQTIFFMAMGFLPIYGLFMLLGVAMLWLYKEFAS